MTVSKPLPLSGTGNTRDLGGYTARSNLVTGWRRFLRSDGVHNLSPEDQRFLWDYGVRLVVDLRTPQEISRQPDRWEACPEMAYLSVPMLDQVNSSFFQGRLPDTMSEMYCSLLDSPSGKQAIRQVFTAFFQTNGGVLYHCTAGKDRTGVLSMLLLKLAGVPDETVIADYAATEGYMEQIFAEQRRMLLQAGYNIPDHVLCSRPEEMVRTLSHLEARYNTVEQYLIGCGLSRMELHKLVSSWLKEPAEAGSPSELAGAPI